MNTFDVATDKNLTNDHDLLNHNEHELRGNMSITKSIVDYYHNYKHNIAPDDLMSLYKTNS